MQSLNHLITKLKVENHLRSKKSTLFFSALIALVLTTNYCNAACTASFTWSLIAPDTIAFTNHSTGIFVGEQWTFGDGSNLYTSVNPTHSYSGPGTYHVCLTLYDSSGICNSVCDTVTVTGPVHCNLSGYIGYPATNASCTTCADGSASAH